MFPLPSYVHDEDEPYRPLVLLWLEPETDLVVGSLLVHPREALESAPESFMNATRAPLAGTPRIPLRVRVASGELAHALQGALGDVEVVHGPTPELDRAVAGMLEHMRNAPRDEVDDDDITHLSSTITPELVARFYTAAATLWKAGPWTRTPPDSYIGVTCPALDIEAGALCVVGQAGESFGFALFRTEAEALSYLEASERNDRSLVPTHIVLGYTPRAEVPRAIVREVMTYHWEVCDEHMYPHTTLIDADLSARPLTRDELRSVTAIVTALADLVSAPDYDEAWDSEGDESLVYDDEIDVEGAIQVILTVPLLLGGEHPDERHDRQADEVHEQGHALLAEFELATDASEATMDYADFLLHGASEEFGRLLVALSPEQLDDLIFTRLPEAAPLDPDEAASVIDALRAVLEFVAKRGTTWSDDARALLESLPADAETRLGERLGDESRFSPFKRIMQAGQAAGFDMSTREGVEAYVASIGGRERATSKKARPRKSGAKPKASKPKASKSKPTKSNAAKTRAAKPKANKPKAAKPKPTKRKATSAAKKKRSR